MKNILFIYCFLFFFIVFAQKYEVPDSISHKNMMVDFRYYVKLLEETHIDPYTPWVANFQQKIPKKHTA